MAERERWNDQAIDQLEDRVETTESHTEALAELPGRIIEVHRDLDAAKTELRKEIKDGFKAMAKRFDIVDEAHENAKPGITLKELLLGAVVPIVLSLIGAVGLILAAAPK